MVKLLEEAFGQKHIVAQTFIDRMRNTTAINGPDPDNLRKQSREMHIVSWLLHRWALHPTLIVQRLSSTEVICRRSMWLETPYLVSQEEQRDRTSTAHINTQLYTEKRVGRAQKRVAFAVVPVLIKNWEKAVQTCPFLDKEARFLECIIQTAKQQFYIDVLLTSVYTL